MTDEKCICRLCLRIISDNLVQTLEEIVNIVESILPKLNLNVSHNPIICNTCNETIHKLYKYKLSCRKIANTSYMEQPKCSRLVAEVKEEGVIDGYCCRVCLQSVEEDNFREFSKLEAGMMELCVPELDPLFLIKNDVICEKCLDRLHIHYNFIEMFSNVEETINNYCQTQSKDVNGKVDLQDILEFSVKTDRYFDKLEIKEEKLQDNSQATGISKTDIHECMLKTNRYFNKLEIKEEKLENSSQLTGISMTESWPIKEEIFIKDESDMYDTDLEMEIQTNEALEIGSPQVLEKVNHKDSAEVSMFKYDYEAKQKAVLRKHTLDHRNSPVLPGKKEKITLECAKCTYLTTDKFLLKRHLMIHQDSSELQMFKCLNCSYDTKFKSNLTKHMLVHRNPTQLEMFKCSQCKYQAKRKKELKVHMLVHKAPSEVTMYKCNECCYQTKQKSCLTKHIWVHKSKDELAMNELLHQCPHCSYMSRQKGALNQHMLLHKKLEETQLYKCSQCSFKSIYKSSLVKHSLVHKCPNEAAMYECDICSFVARTKLDLKAHMKLHGREFKCKECFFETKFKNIFDEHVRIHKGTS